MNVGDKIALWGVILSGLGVIATTTLTILIIKLTKRTTEASKVSALAAQESAKSAKESYELSKKAFDLQIQKDRKIWESLRKRYKKKVLKNAETCYKAIMDAYSIRISPGQTNNIEGMLKSPKTHELSDEILAEYFLDDEADAIVTTWDVFNSFCKDHLKNPYNSEDEATAITAAGLGGGPIDRFFSLIEILKRN